MPISLSPSVDIVERDLTLIAPAVATSIGATAGAFTWGPVLVSSIITEERNLVQRFGKPDADTFTSFFTAANFLSYSSNLRVVRVVGDEAFNATSHDSHVRETFDGDAVETAFALTETFAAEPSHVYVFVGGVLQAETDDYTTGFATNTLTVTFEAGSIPAVGTDNIVVYANAPKILNEDVFENATGLVADFIAKYPGDVANGLKIIAVDATEWANLPTDDQAIFQGAPTGTEIHVAVIDASASFSGLDDQLLEIFEYMSTSATAKKADGTSNYYKTVINNQSEYVWSTGSIADITAAGAGSVTLALGRDDNAAVTDAQKIAGFDKFANAEEIDVSLIMAGAASETVVESIITYVEARQDCMVFISPELADVVNNAGSEVTDTVAFRDTLPSTSYAFLDGNWKYQYDRYNDAYRWVPLNGDIAGLAARTDDTNDTWWSFAGLNRGQIKNVTKLAFNPTKAQRDELYKSQINPVVAFPAQGTVLFGDKTLLSRPSAFDRVNVRRLFIVLEKTISTAAKFSLFEFNDDATRAQFLQLVVPFLRDVQGRRGITDFAVVADETNNTPQVIDSNRFVGDIYIKPARSINNITLNFISTPTGVEFSEVEGVV